MNTEKSTNSGGKSRKTSISYERKSKNLWTSRNNLAGRVPRAAVSPSRVPNVPRTRRSSRRALQHKQ